MNKNETIAFFIIACIMLVILIPLTIGSYIIFYRFQELKIYDTEKALSALLLSFLSAALLIIIIGCIVICFKYAKSIKDDKNEIRENYIHMGKNGSL